MEPKLNSLRTFIGSKNFKISQAFYKDLGFAESKISEKMSVFVNGHIGFYLQDYFVKEWLNNSMLLAEVDNVEDYWSFLVELKLDVKYPEIKLIPIQENDWGKECQLIDPSGILWHFAKFNKKIL